MKRQKTWETLEVGDEIVNKHGDKKYILGVIGRIIFLSSLNMPNRADNFFTKEELVDSQYTIVQDKEEEKTKNNYCSHKVLCTCSNPKETGNIEINTGIGRKQTTPFSLQDEEDVKKLIEETKQELYNFLSEDEGSLLKLDTLLDKWKEVEVDKIKIIK